MRAKQAVLHLRVSPDHTYGRWDEANRGSESGSPRADTCVPMRHKHVFRASSLRVISWSGVFRPQDHQVVAIPEQIQRQAGGEHWPGREEQ